VEVVEIYGYQVHEMDAARRHREFKTRPGVLNLRVPKRPQGSSFLGFLEPPGTLEKALVAVIQEA
jgi:hypothetical protein